jgi:3-hydroxyacyl-[acyl-carrier-protein] dehydratase
MTRELARCLVGVDRADEGVVGRFRLPAGFIGFQGHFPDRPILPGVCEIMAVAATWQQWTGRATTIREIVSAKFLASVLPDREFVVVCREPAGGASSQVLRAVIECEGARVADIVLRVDLGHQLAEVR